MSIVIDDSKDQVSKAENQDLKHMVIKNGREKLFDIYDTAVKKHCADEDSIKDKKPVVREAWKILADFLFRLDRLDFHNGCYTSDINFPSVIYE